jgi:PTH1 family peptidyl-tRNA hydrolase
VKLVVGLGNPGRQYESTRHNAGWWLLDRMAEEWSFDPWRKNMDALVTSRRLHGTIVRLVKPLTYMNLSGAALTPYLRRPGFSPAADLLVVVDEVALALGRFRLRADGSAGGHNGLKSIEASVGSNVYSRLRIGIRPEHEGAVRQLSNFVLGPLSAAEVEILDGLAPELIATVDTWLRDGTLTAMNKHNRKHPPPAGE